MPSIARFIGWLVFKIPAHLAALLWGAFGGACGLGELLDDVE
jgi:hypothetical protein